MAIEDSGHDLNRFPFAAPLASRQGPPLEDRLQPFFDLILVDEPPL